MEEEAKQKGEGEGRREGRREAGRKKKMYAMENCSQTALSNISCL